MFFIDRDFDDSLAMTNKDLFETPCHSVENLYVQEDCLKEILKSEFHITIANSDFNKRVNDFNLRIKEFNALLLLNKTKKLIVTLIIEKLLNY